MTAEVKFRAIEFHSSFDGIARGVVVDNDSRPQAYCENLSVAEQLAETWNKVGFATFPRSTYSSPMLPGWPFGA